MPEPTIGGWTQGQLVKFFQNMLKLHPPESAVNLTVDDVVVTKTLTCVDQLQFSAHKRLLDRREGLRPFLPPQRATFLFLIIRARFA